VDHLWFGRSFDSPKMNILYLLASQSPQIKNSYCHNIHCAHQALLFSFCAGPIRSSRSDDRSQSNNISRASQEPAANILLGDLLRA
jgi:hypothetical protein